MIKKLKSQNFLADELGMSVGKVNYVIHALIENFQMMGKVRAMNDIVYNDGEIELEVSVNGETVWLNKNQIDVITSVGYRVKSQKGVGFRQWATSVLKNYISNGYAINSEKITNERFDINSLEISKKANS